MEPIDPGFTGR